MQQWTGPVEQLFAPWSAIGEAATNDAKAAARRTMDWEYIVVWEMITPVGVAKALDDLAIPHKL